MPAPAVLEGATLPQSPAPRNPPAPAGNPLLRPALPAVAARRTEPGDRRSTPCAAPHEPDRNAAALIASEGGVPMNTMEITKFVGAICGSLLVFLLINTAAHAIFDTSSDVVAFSVEAPEGGAGGEGEAPAEEVDVAVLVAAADPAAGETIFKKCAACHKIDGTNGVGPHLDAVVGRPVASVPDFSYSDAMKAHGGEWTPENIFHFLANPKKEVPGTKMTFAGLPKPEDRANVIAYLEQHGG
jgi:cytochrome c